MDKMYTIKNTLGRQSLHYKKQLWQTKLYATKSSLDEQDIYYKSSLSEQNLHY